MDDTDDAKTSLLESRTITGKIRIDVQKLLFKHFILVTIAVHNSLIVLLMRYTKQQEGCNLYSSGAVNLCSELVKFVSIGFINAVWYRDEFKSITLFGLARIAIPAILFMLQNNMQVVALSYISASMFQLLMQTKILTTAVFGRLILGQQLDRRTWIALLILTLGVITTQYENLQYRSTNFLIGITLVGFLVISSGISAVYMEKILKEEQTSLLVRNIELCMVSIPLQGAIVIWRNPNIAVNPHVLFEGFCYSTYVLVGMFSFGGFLVSLVMRFADNNLKNIAFSVSMVISTCVSYFWSDWTPTVCFLTGASLVLLSVLLFSC